MISLRIVSGQNYDKINTQGLIYIQLTFGNGLDYEYYQHYGHMDNQTLLKHKFSNTLMVSVIHNFNQISPPECFSDVFLNVSILDLPM